jgi:hypothetical protein
VLGAMRRLVGPSGTVLIVDERVPDTFAPNGDDVERMMYGFGVMVTTAHAGPSRSSAC